MPSKESSPLRRWRRYSPTRAVSASRERFLLVGFWGGDGRAPSKFCERTGVLSRRRSWRAPRLGRAAVAAVALLGFAAVACEVNTEVTVDVEENGSGVISVGIGVSVATAEALGGEDGAGGYESQMPLADLGAAGWSYEGLTREPDNLYWLRASKPFGNPEQMTGVLSEIAGPGVFTDFELARETSFARQNWAVTGEIDLNRAVRNVFADSAGLNGLWGLVQAIENAGLRTDDSDAATALANALSLRLEVLLPGQVSETSVLELDASSSPLGTVSVTSEATDTTARTVRYLAIAAGALFIVSVALGGVRWAYKRRKQKSSADALIAKARKADGRFRAAMKAAKKAGGPGEIAGGPGEQEYESFAEPASDLEMAPYDYSAADESSLQSAEDVEASPDGQRRSPEGQAAPKPAPGKLQLVCVGAWGVLLEPADPVEGLLLPFVRSAGSSVDENVVRSAYREAVRGRTTLEMLWSDCGLDGQPRWPEGGPGSDRAGVHPGAREFLQRLTSTGVFVASVADGIGRWLRELLLAGNLEGIATLMASSEMGMSETDPNIFKALEDATGIPPAGCLVIHTRPEVLDAAASVGMSTASYGAAAGESGHPALATLLGE